LRLTARRNQLEADTAATVSGLNEAIEVLQVQAGAGARKSAGKGNPRGRARSSSTGVVERQETAPAASSLE
jgi:hypothetical protein